MKKYICIGGYIFSKNDDDRHYIPPTKLAELYNVNPKECYFAKNEDSEILHGLRLEELIVLRPKYDGNYKLPIKGGEQR